MRRVGTSARVDVTVEAGGRRLTVAADAVCEVLAAPRLTPAPRAPAMLRGLANIRGKAAPVIDLGLWLGCASTVHSGPILVVGGEAPVGLQVERVVGVTSPEAEPGSGHEAPTERLDLDALLGQPVVAGARNGRAAAAGRVRLEASAAAGSAQPFLVMSVSGQAFGLPLGAIARVETVAFEADRTRSDPHLGPPLDLVRRQGREAFIVPLAELIGLTPQPASPRSRLVVIRTQTGASLDVLVDAVQGIARAPAQTIVAAPPRLNRGPGAASVDRIVRTPAGLVAILDIEGLPLQPSHARRATPAAASTDRPAMAPVATRRLLRVWLGGDTYGVPLDAVERVVPAPSRLTRLPHSPDVIFGLINDRGAALAVLDVRPRLGLPAPARQRGGQVVLISVAGRRAGLLVDRADAVVGMSGPDEAALRLIAPEALLRDAQTDLVRSWRVQAKTAA